MMTEVRVWAKKNSSVRVFIDGEMKADLCRCGHSATKPICDGTHKTIAFEAEEAELKIL